MGTLTKRPSVPDLFSMPSGQEKSSSSVRVPASSPGNRPPTTPSSPRHVLPSDLTRAIKQLDDDELDRLFSAVVVERKRRGKKLPDSDYGQQRSKAPMRSLTSGQVKAVRAAFKAGVTPSRIARQFGLSQADVKRALASDEMKR